jgi:hypothetical protein
MLVLWLVLTGLLPTERTGKAHSPFFLLSDLFFFLACFLDRGKLDIVTGTLGKAYGVIGGYIAGSNKLVDMVRSYGAGLIFTTSLPPAVVAGALASVKYLKTSQAERDGQRKNVRSLKTRLNEMGIPMVPSPGHIIPIHVCCVLSMAGHCFHLVCFCCWYCYFFIYVLILASAAHSQTVQLLLPFFKPGLTEVIYIYICIN